MLQKYIVMIRDDIKNAMSKRCGGDELNNLLMLLGFLFVREESIISYNLFSFQIPPTC